MFSEADKTGSASPKIALPEGSLAWDDLINRRPSAAMFPIGPSIPIPSAVAVCCGGRSVIANVLSAEPAGEAAPGFACLLIEAAGE